MLDILDISTTALVAQRQRLTGITNNIANAETTRSTVDANGDPVPYSRRTTLMSPRGGKFGKALKGVYASYVKDPRPFKEVYRPGHPDANPTTGYLKLPNVDPTVEFVDGMNALRSYEMNVQAMNVTKNMISSAMRILA